jgi:type IV pilus assembly protein PilO
MNFIDEILKQKLAVKVLALVLVIALIGGAYWKVFYSPLKQEIDMLEPQLNQLMVELNQKKAIVAERPRYEAELERTRQELVLALKQLPDKSEIPTLLENVSALGKASGLNFELFKPQAEVPKNFYAEIPVDIKVTGQYKDIVMFFERVSQMPRIVTISNIVISQPQKAGSTTMLSTTCNATTYKFIEGAAPK